MIIRNDFSFNGSKLKLALAIAIALVYFSSSYHTSACLLNVGSNCASTSALKWSNKGISNDFRKAPCDTISQSRSYCYSTGLPVNISIHCR